MTLPVVARLLLVLSVVCWSRVRRGYANVEWRFSTRDFAFIMPTRGLVDPAHRSPFPSSTNYHYRYFVVNGHRGRVTIQPNRDRGLARWCNCGTYSRNPVQQPHPQPAPSAVRLRW